MYTDTDSDMIETAIDAVNGLLGPDIELRLVEEGRVRVELPGEPHGKELIPVCRKQVTRGQLFSIYEACRRPDALLVTPHIPAGVAEELRGAGVNFMDAAGNAHFRAKGVLVFAVGRRPQHRPETSLPVAPRMFQKTGLIFLFELMVRDFKLIGRSYRQLRDETGVSLGSLRWIMASLRANGFLIEDKHGRRIADRKRLLQEWSVAYRQRLRPAQTVGVYRSRLTKPLMDLELPPGVRWGGESAAASLGAGLRPGFHTAYTPPATPNHFIAKAGLREDPDGDIEILTTFWQKGTEADWPPCTVHPLLVYADLITSGDSRKLDVGSDMYEKHLKNRFEVAR